MTTVYARIPTPDLKLWDILKATAEKENATDLALELVGFIWEEMSESVLAEAVAALHKWHKDNDMEWPTGAPPEPTTPYARALARIRAAQEANRAAAEALDALGEAKHAVELRGAANIMDTWIAGLRRDLAASAVEVLAEAEASL